MTVGGRSARLRRLVSYYRPYRGTFVAVLAAALAVAAITTVLPLGVRSIAKVVQEGDAARSVAHIYRVAGVMLLLVAIKAACGYYVDYRGHALGAEMESDLRCELFGHLMRLTFAYYDGERTGQLMSRITHDLLWLAEFYHHVPEDIVINVVKFCGAFFVLASINARLTLVLFALLPLMAAYAVHCNRRMRRALRLTKERIADVNAQVEDTLAGIRVVQSFANEALEGRKFARENARFLNSRCEGYRSEAYLSLGTDSFTYVSTVAVIAVGGALAASRALDLADLLTFLLYLGSLTQPITGMLHIAHMYQEGITGFERFMEVLETPPQIADAPDAAVPESVRGRVTFRDVGFRYGAHMEYVLRGLTLDVQPGEYVALVGPSGVGKTTLCSLIPRFYDVSEGAVLLDGVDVRGIRLEALRASVGVVQQDVYLFAGTVLENIRYGRPGASREEVEEAARLAGAHEFIARLPKGYDTDIGERGVRLSGGQKQRLSIARVFLKDPAVLIFDEATSQLDGESERAVQEALEALARGRTTFVIAHRLSTVRRAGRILVLEEQGIVEEGTHSELLARGGAYARMCEAQLYGLSAEGAPTGA